MLLKQSKESATIHSDKCLPCIAEPFGMSPEILARGLICLKFLTLRKDLCRIDQGEWNAFNANYMLRNDLFELEKCTLLGGSRHYHVKMGPDCKQKALECINGVDDGSLRIPRRIFSGGKKSRVFDDALLELISSECDDEGMEVWLTSDAEQVQQTNKKGDSNESDRKTDNNTGTASPPKADSGSTSITPNALSNSEMKATLVPSNNFLSQGKQAEKEVFPFLHAFNVPIDNDDMVEISLGMQFAGLWSTRKE
jgi:hypothetical protein